jgi:hypothetical protein
VLIFTGPRKNGEHGLLLTRKNTILDYIKIGLRRSVRGSLRSVNLGFIEIMGGLEMSTEALKSTEVAIRESSDSNALMRIIDRAATDPAFDIQKLQQLLDVKERWEKNEACKAYVAAMNAFKADPPEVFKSKHVSFDTAKGKTEYDHALLEDAVTAIGVALSKHGLSFRWDCEQMEAMIRVTCIITHAQGHSEKTWLQSGADQSGGKNNIQALGSTVTYLQRYTLFAATGLAAKGMDDDGKKSELEVITPEQALGLHAKLTDNDINIDKFNDWLRTDLKCDKLDELPVQAFKTVESRIDAAIKARAKKKEDQK